MPRATKLSRSQALDKLLLTFTALGLRDNGEGRRIIDALLSRRTVAGACEADVVPQSFIVNNGMTRERLVRTVESVLGDVEVHADPADAVGVTVQNQRIVINNSGNLGGVVGVGTVKAVKQSQRSSYKLAGRLTSEYRTDPEIREIIDAPIALSEKHTKLQTLLEGTKGLATDLASKVVTNLLTGSGT